MRMNNPENMRPGIPAPTVTPQPAPQAAMPVPMPQHMQPVGINAGELGRPWEHTFQQPNAPQMPKKPVDINQGLAGLTGAAGNVADFGFL